MDLVGRRVAASGVAADLDTRSVERDGQAVTLTGLEFDVLVALMTRAGRVVPRSALLELAGRSDVFLGVGAGLAVGAVIAYFIERGSSSTETLR